MPPRQIAIGMLNDVQCGDLFKLLWWDGDGLCLFAKRLERGRFVWPRAEERRGGADAGAIVDAAGGDRLANASANLAS